MPIYEYLCTKCNTLLSFFSSRIDPSGAPACPHCGGATGRRPARFAIAKSLGSKEGDDAPDDDIFAGIDEERLESVMESMGSELESMADDEDPRAMARIFRRFGDATGLELGPRMEEMLRRLERGEDPESIEEELDGGEGDPEGGDDDLEEWIRVKKAVVARRRRPRVDDTLYFMEPVTDAS